MTNRIIIFRAKAAAVLAALVLVMTTAYIVHNNRNADMRIRAKRPHIKLSSLYMKANTQIYQSDGSTTSDYAEIWYLAPNKFRIESVHTRSKQTNILRGNLQIVYADDSQAAVYSPAFSNARSYINQNTLSEILESTRYKIHTNGEKTVAGRKCDSIALPTNNGFKTSCCIDRQTGIAIANSITENNGATIKTFASSFKPNTPIKESVFNPKLPKGMPVVRVPFQSEVSMMLIYPVPRETSNIDWGIPTVDIKHLRDQSKVSDDLHEILKDDHKIELKELYEPTYIPPRFLLLKAIGNSKARKTRKGWSVSTSYDVKTFDRIEINYIDPKTGDALILIEDANPPKSDSAAVSVKGFDGKVAVKTDPFPYTYLTWSKDGVFFKLGAVNENKDALIKVAESMKMMQ